MAAGLRSVRRRLPFLVGMGLLAFLAYNVIQLRGMLPQYFWSGDYLLRGVSFLIVMSCLLLLSFGWQLILRALGANLNWAKGTYIYFYSNLMRYVPGTFWYLLSRVHLCQKEGIGREKSSLSLVLELCLAVSSALLVGTGILVRNLGGLSILPIVGISVLLLLSLRPAALVRLVNAILRRIKREQIALDLRYEHMLLLLVPYLGSWILYGVGFRVLLQSLGATNLPDSSTIISIYALSWAAGFLCLPIPQGMGVRDAALAYLLSSYMPFSIASLAALAWRLWILVGEIACMGLAAVLSRSLRAT